MLKALSLLAFLCLLPAFLSAQILPQERVIEWDKAGRFESFSPAQIIDITTLGAPNNGSEPVQSYIQQAIGTLPSEGGVVYLPAGSYLLTEPVQLPAKTILRGAGIGQTILQINHTGEAAHGIEVLGQPSDVEKSILSPLPKGTKQFAVPDLENLEVGDFIMITEDDQDLIHNVWASFSTSQIVQIKSLGDNLIRLRSPLRRAFQEDKNPRITKLDVVPFVGIESLTIERLDPSDKQVSNIYFDLAVNSWIKCVESIKCNFAHFELIRCSNNEVSGCYLRDGWDYGGGGKAYGVMIQYAASENLVYNNIFQHLRHSMILQSGANGNVLAYNYSSNPYWTGTIFPSDAAGEIVLHGNYPYANLFEGNIVQNVAIDDSHGVQGPNNTFLRNKIQGYGLVMGIIPVSDRQNFIGNVVTGSGLFSLQGEYHFLYGNNILGNTLPPETENLADLSYFLEEPPLYYQEVGTWPAIGYPTPVELSDNEAAFRFELEEWVVCNTYEPPVINSLAVPQASSPSWQLSPNPAQFTVRITSDLEIAWIELWDLQGQMRLRSPGQETLTLPPLPAGMYWVRMQTAKGQTDVQKLLIQQ